MITKLPLTLPDGDLAVRTEALTKRFGDVPAVRELALQVPRGAEYLLVGPNGAGKSTTLKLLLGLLQADAGVAEVLGLDSAADDAAVRANVGYVPEGHQWGSGWMRVGRLLAHHRLYYPRWDDAYARHLIEAFDLNLEQRVSALSKGHARRLHLTMALAHRPPLLLLDEPTDGLDPLMRDETLGILAAHLGETPTTVLLCTHHVEEVERIADHIGVLRAGELRAQMPIEVLRRQLRRYRAGVPEAWQGAPAMNGSVLRRNDAPREFEWTIWGEEPEVAEALERSGATVRDSAPLSLSEAAVALLDPRV